MMSAPVNAGMEVACRQLDLPAIDNAAICGIIATNSRRMPRGWRSQKRRYRRTVAFLPPTVPLPPARSIRATPPRRAAHSGALRTG